MYNRIPRSLHDNKEVSILDIGVYSALCYFSDENGVCWPSHKKIMEKAKVSEPTVKRSIKRLEKEGYLTIKPQYDSIGRPTSNKYYLNMDRLNDMVKDICMSPAIIREPYTHNDRPLYPNSETPIPLTTEPYTPNQRSTNNNQRTITKEHIPNSDTKNKSESAREFVSRVYGEVQDTYEARQQIIMMQAIFDLADTMPEKQRDRAMLCELNSEMIDLYEAIDVSVLTGIINKIITHQKDPNRKWNKGKPYVNIKRTLIDWFNREARHGT